MTKRNATDLALRAAQTIERYGLAANSTPVLLMVSGGSDSTALAYVACELREAGVIGPLAMLHVNHHLRGEDANADARFAEGLAELLGIPLFMCDIDVAALVARTGENMEAAARRERYAAARDALRSHCAHAAQFAGLNDPAASADPAASVDLASAAPTTEGRIFTAHTADDRAENFYMRSIVGTGPGGFRSMRYINGSVARPLMDASREELRDYLNARAQAGLPVARDEQGNLWREDATNAHTDLFRGYVRHEIVPRAKARNPRLLETLGRSMNLIADEDDFLESLAHDVAQRCITWIGDTGASVQAGFVLSPEFGAEPLVLRRRACFTALGELLGHDVRVENAAVSAVLDAFDDAGKPKSGYVTNIQGNLAVSANKRGVRVEPMEMFRARRKRR